jgi:hypothetical protein
MNAQQALDLATEHCITVTMDRDLRDCSTLRRIIATEFKVGDYTIVRGRGQNRWSIMNGKSGGTFCYPSGPKCGKTILLPRGDTMQFAIELTLGLELTAYSKGD